MMHVFAALLLAQVQTASAPRAVTLETPERVLQIDFTQIRGVRELPDGRVMVADRLDHGVVVVNFATSQLQRIGRTGNGPQEYRLPTALTPIGGDSTLLSDEGNQRMVIIGPDLRIHRAFTLMVPGIASPISPRTADAQGRYYFQMPWWMLGDEPGDTLLPVFRYDERTRRLDTLFRVKGLTAAKGPAPRPRIPYVVFAPQDGWAMGRDGRIVIARSSDYHVEWRDATGTTTKGPVVAFDRRQVTGDDRFAYAKAFTANSGTSNRDGSGISATPTSELRDEAVRALVESSFWAEFAAPFADRAPLVAPDGTAWVERSMRRGEPSTWDVFDHAGRNVARVRLPAGRRLIAFGATWTYLVATDADGVERLERYRREPM